MTGTGIICEKWPKLTQPVCVIGFEGWGNALNVSTAMVDYFTKHLNAKIFARLDADRFYRYDESRPMVKINQGILDDLVSPGGHFYAAALPVSRKDMVILRADEPQLCWHQFAQDIMALCRRTGVEQIITVGSMYDNVLHGERIISAIASDTAMLKRLNPMGVRTVNYHGPSAIHSLIHRSAQQQGLTSLSLWCHCPYYLQGVTHFGMLDRLAEIIGAVAGFTFDTADLKKRWLEMRHQIDTLVQENTKAQQVIAKIRREKRKGLTGSLKSAPPPTSDKIINIEDFLDPN